MRGWREAHGMCAWIPPRETEGIVGVGHEWRAARVVHDGADSACRHGAVWKQDDAVARIHEGLASAWIGRSLVDLDLDVGPTFEITDLKDEMFVHPAAGAWSALKCAVCGKRPPCKRNLPWLKVAEADCRCSRCGMGVGYRA